MIFSFSLDGTGWFADLASEDCLLTAHHLVLQLPGDIPIIVIVLLRVEASVKHLELFLHLPDSVAPQRLQAHHGLLAENIKQHLQVHRLSKGGLL